VIFQILVCLLLARCVCFVDVVKCIFFEHNYPSMENGECGVLWGQGAGQLPQPANCVHCIRALLAKTFRG
jgi:hypothetical protein